MTKQQYIEYLIATPENYTCTNLADHLEGKQAQSHDTISDYLRREKITPRRLWEVVQPLLNDSSDSYLIVDDSVQDKRYSKKIELVKRQYSGAAGGLVDGIGIVNLLHSDGQEFYPIDFRLYAPEQDGKTKNDHFLEMLRRAKSDKGLKANTVLFDSWYASVDNLKAIHRLGMIFVTTLKENRLVSLSKETGYVHLDTLTWDKNCLTYGSLVKLKEMPFLVRLFKLVATNGDIEWVITNRHLNQDNNGDAQAPLTAQDVQDENAVRWQIEQLHRELKQLVGTQKCQCRKARSQRNHLALCYLAWLSLKVHATRFCITLYAARTNLFRDYLRAELRNPTIQAYCA
jgi:SRSO17 transposase